MWEYREVITRQEGLGSRLKIPAGRVSFLWQSALLEQTFQQVCLQYQHVSFSFCSEGGSWNIKLHSLSFAFFFFFFTIFAKNIIYMLICNVNYNKVTISWWWRSKRNALQLAVVMCSYLTDIHLSKRWKGSGPRRAPTCGSGAGEEGGSFACISCQRTTRLIKAYISLANCFL